MKAVITINHRSYLINDAKKALALVEVLRGSKQLVDGYYGQEKIILTNEGPDITMQTLPVKTKIIQPKV